MHKDFNYSSIFADLISTYIQSRREAGFMFDNPAYWLFRFDQFCKTRQINKAEITKELYDSWSAKQLSESKTTQSNRLQALRCFSIHLNSIGIPSYIPTQLPKPEKTVPYLMSDKDVREFFKQVDLYESDAPVKAFERLATEYKVLFRLIYCCGLRNNEACTLRLEDVDTDSGTLTIIHSKGNKDRIVYLSDDVCQLCTEYKQWLKEELSDTYGCCTDTSCYGDQNTAPDLSLIKNGTGESWDLWKNIAAQAKNGEYGNPDKFCDDFEATNWMSATVETSDEEIIQKIISICKRDSREGKVTTGGIVTVKDSTDNWYLSWTINRQPQFKAQDKNTVLIWVYALTTNKEGNYVKKAMRDCTGEEVCREWLYHIGVPTDQIDDWAKNRCNTTTCFMPYINAFFQPRKESDRPLVVPEGAVNFAFLGQFAETPRDTIFTTEYSIRTGMEAVYTLMNVDRGVPEVWGSKYDVRELLRAAYYAVDKKPIDELPLSLKEKVVLKKVIKAVEGTDLEILLKESGLLR